MMEKLIFEPEKGILFDIIWLTGLPFCDAAGEGGGEIRKIPELYACVDADLKGGRLLFSQGAAGGCLMTELTREALQSSPGTDTFISAFRNRDYMETVVNTLAYFDRKRFKPRFYSILAADRTLFTEFLDNLDIGPEIKWELSLFVAYPDSFIIPIFKAMDRAAAALQGYYAAHADDFAALCTDLKNDLFGEKSSLLGKLPQIAERPVFSMASILPYPFYYMSGQKPVLCFGRDYRAQTALLEKLSAAANPAAVFRALGDRTRMEVIARLRSGEKSVGELTAALGIPMSTLSHHLDVLADAGVLTRRKEGKNIYCSLNYESEQRLLERLKEIYI